MPPHYYSTWTSGTTSTYPTSMAIRYAEEDSLKVKPKGDAYSDMSIEKLHAELRCVKKHYPANLYTNNKIKPLQVGLIHRELKRRVDATLLAKPTLESIE